MVIGELATILTAKSTQFVKDMDIAKKSVGDFGTTATTVGGILTGGLTAPIVGVGAAVGAAILKTTSLADEMLKLSQRSGLSTTTLQELKYAGDIAGTSIDAIVTSTAFLSRNAVDAAKGVGEAKDAFKALGINVRDTTGAFKTQDALLIETLTKLSGVKDSTLQAALAADLLGRGAKDLGPLLAQGGAGIDALRKRAHELGIVMNTETISTFDTLDDTLTDVKTAFTGATSNIASGFVPILKDTLFPLVQNMIIPGIQTLGSVVKFAVDIFAELPAPVQIGVAALGAILAAVGPLTVAVGFFATTVLPGLSAALAAAGGAAGILAGAMAILTSPITLTIAAIVGLTLAWAAWGDDLIKITGSAIDFVIGMFNKWLSGLNSIIGDINGLLGTSFGTFELFATEGPTIGKKFMDTVGGMDASIRGFVGNIWKSAPALQTATTNAAQLDVAVQGIHKAAIPIPDAIEDIIAPMHAVLTETQMIAFLLEKQPLDMEKIDANFQLWEEHLFKTRHEQDLLAAKQKEMTGTSSVVRDNFARMATDLLLGKQSLGDMVKNLAKMAAFNAVKGGISAGLNLIPGGGILGGIGKGLGKLFGFQHGGFIPAGGEPILGLFERKQDEAVIPLGSPGAKNMLGGVGGLYMPVTIYGSVGVEDIAERIVDELRRKGVKV